MDYNRFVRLLSASFYALSVQGRPMAIGEISVEDGNCLIQSGMVKSRNLKTKKTYGYQIVTASEYTIRLLEMYKFLIRPVLLLKSGESPKYFLLNYDGVRSLEVGRRATEFYQHQLHLHLNTNTLRSIVETEFHKMYLQGIKFIKVQFIHLSNASICYYYIRKN